MKIDIQINVDGDLDIKEQIKNLTSITFTLNFANKDKVELG